MQSKNIFCDIPRELKDEFFEELASNKDVKIERIVSYGHTSPKNGWYDQEQNEWVIVLKGKAVIAFEDKDIRLKSGDYVNIPAHTKHKVSWTLPNSETIWLAVFY